jgi:hypothetical protein
VDWDWKKVKSEYITSEKSSYRKLAEKYDIPLGTLQKRAKKENWPDLKKQSGDRTVAKTITVIEKKQVDKFKRIQDIADKLLDKIEKAVDELDIHLAKKTIKTKEIEYHNYERPDKPTKETINETEEIIDYHSIIDRKGVQELAAAIKNLKEVQMLKSELDEKEQEARIAKLQRDAEINNNDDNKPHGVVLMPPIMDDLTPPKEETDE